MIDRLEDPSKVFELQGSFADDPNVLIGLSCWFIFWIPLRPYFDILHVIHRPTLTLDRLLLRNTITRCSNNNVHYDLSLCS